MFCANLTVYHCCASIPAVLFYRHYTQLQTFILVTIHSFLPVLFSLYIVSITLSFVSFEVLRIFRSGLYFRLLLFTPVFYIPLCFCIFRRAYSRSQIFVPLRTRTILGVNHSESSSFEFFSHRQPDHAHNLSSQTSASSMLALKQNASSDIDRSHPCAIASRFRFQSQSFQACCPFTNI